MISQITNVIVSYYFIKYKAYKPRFIIILNMSIEKFTQTEFIVNHVATQTDLLQQPYSPKTPAYSPSSACHFSASSYTSSSSSKSERPRSPISVQSSGSDENLSPADQQQTVSECFVYYFVIVM